jgi:hypothetical protein
MPDLHDRLRDLDLLDVPDVMRQARQIGDQRPPMDHGRARPVGLVWRR